MNRQIIPIICALVATLTSHVNAAVEIGGLYYNIDSNAGTASVTPNRTFSGTSTDPYQYITGDVIIPATVEYSGETLKVISIDAKAFYNCKGITSISIPPSINSINLGAFNGCSSLTSVSIPDSVSTISGDAFANCSGLISVNIGEGVSEIGMASFYGCSNLTVVSIPSTVNNIDNEAFRSCSNLENVIINKTDLSGIVNTNGKVFEGTPNNRNLYLPLDNFPKDEEGNPKTKVKIDKYSFSAIPFVATDYNAPYTRSEGLDNQCVIYYRDFASIQNWQALYLPFTSDYSEWKDYFIIADLVTTKVDGEQDVLYWYELGGDNDEYNQVLAGHPYIIKRRPDTTLPADMQSFMIFNDKSLTPADAQPNHVTKSGVFGDYTLGGSYIGISPSDITTGDFYALGLDGNFVKAQNSSQTLSANRIYLISQKKNSAQANQAPFRMSFLEEDPGEPSSIDDCVAIEQPGDDAVYDLYGRRVANPKSGIYIKNGRKFIIK